MIAMSLFTDAVFGRMVQRGVARYAREHQGARWGELMGIPHELLGPGVLKRSRADGLIVGLWQRSEEDEVLAMGVPAVNLTMAVDGGRLPAVVVDDQQVGRLAAEHFLTRGYNQFAYVVGDLPASYALTRGRSFAATVNAAGYEVTWYGESPLKLPPGARRATGEITRWLQDLPKPVAIFAATDKIAAEVLASTIVAGLAVPEQVAILGVDNDPIVHYMGTGISSIELPAEEVGYQAASLLDRLMDGGKADQQVTYLAPASVVTRSSTDTRAIKDADVLAAMRFIRENGRQILNVDAVAEAVAIGRRSLERRFRRALGFSPKDEIRRVCMGHACRLLGTTRLGVDEVGRMVGFESRSQFFAAFRKSIGMTPTAYRRTATASAGARRGLQ